LSRWSGRLLDRYGNKPPLVVGPVIAAVGLVLFARLGIGGSYWTTFFPAIIVLALGMTISVAPLTTIVINAVENRYAGTASGVNNAVSRTANLLAVTVLGVVALTAFDHALNKHLADLDVLPAAERAVRQTSDQLAATPIPKNISPAQGRALEKAIDQSFIGSFRIVMLTAAALALVGAFCAGIMINPSRA
jgi:MFS family permease